MTQQTDILAQFRTILGASNLYTGEKKTAYYRSGFRSGIGGALAVAFPQTLLQQWQVLQVCVDNGCAIIMQGAKTGLTEGSCPSGDDYGRPVVIINTSRLKKLILLAGGKQALAFPGTTLHELENQLAPLQRAPHSVIGSTTIGATIVGGIANNAGGALCKRGSSYTTLSLFAQVNADGKLCLVNKLGIKGLGDTPEEIFERLESGRIDDADLEAWDAPASDREYADRIRDLETDAPNRYNADPKRLCDVSGSAGKVAAFAVRVDTYPLPKKKQVFFLGSNNPNDFSALRTHILGQFKELPEMCEYMNRDIFTVAERYGKDVFLSIKYIGTRRLPAAYALKSAVEYRLNKLSFLPKFLPDLSLYHASRLFPQHLPQRLLEYRDRFKYYLILSMSDDGIEEARRYLSEQWSQREGVDFFECTPKEQEAAMLHRFAAAGAAIRYQNVHQKQTEEVLALDVALLGNDPDWVETLPPEVSEHLDLSLDYGHFMCHVFHRDYIFKKGTDLKAMKALLLERLDAKGAKYPAEHNVGHLYQAEPQLKAFYEQLDPTNTFNPGIGKSSKRPRSIIT
ncbi:D-lactate dehydrogenase [Coraliomargarita sp. SDUM461003]|uniref:D-lactate dehydrogenase n=1 Tax=Thalassobacterium maritimum TaxID=3041265 RepID=A0ABU1ASJ5_9BACT|nr:D-lactate dehydrogenase [Coraliomargarita sp. SDUM461003]MDQ8207131.1 D-lactate dehydrogenase [Coraliomargarita sp. SDUM461003]